MERYYYICCASMLAMLIYFGCYRVWVRCKTDGELEKLCIGLIVGIAITFFASLIILGEMFIIHNA